MTSTLETQPVASPGWVDRTGHMLPQERAKLATEAIERLLAAATADRGRA